MGSQTLARAQGEPQPPCAGEVFPPYPEADHSPVVKTWDRAAFGRDWTPPACTGWSERGFSTLVVTVARFRDSADMGEMLHRVGAISQLAGMRYWSTTQKRWEPLIVSASAVAGPTGNRLRDDFSVSELSAGGSFYFEQTDNLTGKATYRMGVLGASGDRLVFETENVTTMHYYRVPVFHSGDIQSIYFLERESPGVWRYYSMARTGKNANTLVAGHEASSINRAVAFFRHWVGIPTDREPPVAR